MERLARHSAFATLIEVDAARGPAEDAGDLLERSAGLTVRRYGGPGSLATISIRGANPGEIEVFLDRTPLRTASQSVVDLSVLDLAQIEYVEIYRSTPPTDLGGEVAGSAIRLVTRSGGARSVVFRADAGSYGTGKVEALATGAWKGHRYFLSASRFRTDGDFLYFNDNGTEHETSDDAWLHWSNGDATRDALFGKINLALPFETGLEWSSQLSKRDQGIPGTSHLPTEAVRLTSESALHRAEISAGPHFHQSLHANLYGFVERADNLYEDPLREMGITGTPREVDQRFEREGIGLAAQWQWLTPSYVLGGHSCELLIERRDEDLRNLPPPGRPEEDHRQRRSRLLSLGDNWDSLDGRLRVSAFYRWEESRDNFNGANPWRPFSSQPEHTSTAQGPRIGARITLGKGHSIKANLAHQARFPTFTELFGYGGTIQGNATLEPETGRRWDAGWIWKPAAPLPGGMQLWTEHVYYESRLDQMIVFITISNRETKPLNLDQARIRGYEATVTMDHLPLVRDLTFLSSLEGLIVGLLGKRSGDTPASETAATSDSATASASAAAPGSSAASSSAATPGSSAGTAHDASLTFHLAWQDARDEGASPIYHGKQLTYHPPLQSNVRLDLIQQRWRMSYTARYQAGSFWGRSNLPEFETADQWRHDLLIRCHLKQQKVIASLRIENLLDSELEDVRGYPLPGRSWFGGLEMRF
jgi:iron complex outermembrane receptor protein